MVKHYEPTHTFTLSPVVEAGQHGADRVRERFHCRGGFFMGGRRLGLGAPTRVGAGSDREHEPLSSVIAGRCEAFQGECHQPFVEGATEADL
jgi:hypothetical protein